VNVEMEPEEALRVLFDADPEKDEGEEECEQPADDESSGIVTL
jgi:hypothetical protein